MQREITENLDDIISTEDDSIGLPKIIFLSSLVIGLGIYVGILLYGKSSLSVLNELEAKEEYLETSIKNLKDENAILQKKYFELKGLEPQ